MNRRPRFLGDGAIKDGTDEKQVNVGKKTRLATGTIG